MNSVRKRVSRVADPLGARGPLLLGLGRKWHESLISTDVYTRVTDVALDVVHVREGVVGRTTPGQKPTSEENEVITGGSVHVADGLLSMILTTCQTPWATIK